MNSVLSSSISAAKAVIHKNPLFLDTETTGLDTQSEIIEISITDDMGDIVFSSFVKPKDRIGFESFMIHGIDDEMVKDAPTWDQIYPRIREVLKDRLVVIYNAKYDIRLMRQSHGKYKMIWRDEFQAFDLMKLYAEYNGLWDTGFKSYKFVSLKDAGSQCGIVLENTHRATDDCLLSWAVLHHIAGI